MMRAAGGFQQGFVRVEAFGEGGDVRIEAWDDSGVRRETILNVDAGEIQGFTSDDLQYGNAAKGIPEGIGNPSVGDWRLRLTSDFDFDINAYVRTRDGFVTQLDSTLGATNASVAEVSFFNPASNSNQRSKLRIINESESAVVTVNVTGLDDRGNKGQRSFSTSIQPLNAVSVTAPELERRFGDGTGKWRLIIASDHPVKVVNLLETPTGHVSRLEPSVRRLECSASSFIGYRLPYGANLGYADRRGYDGSDPNLNLVRSTWRYEDLARANFTGADLFGSRFFRANLRFADLSGASLNSVGFQVVDLTGADLNASELNNTDFRFAVMRGVNLSRAIGTRAIFNGALLCKSNLSSANLGYSDFRGANLSGSDGRRAEFDGARFARANMSLMNLHGATMEGANFHHTNLAGSDLTDVDFEGADLHSAALVGARLSESNLERANLSWSDLSRVVAREVDFQSATLSSAQAYRADFRDTDFTKSDLTWVFFVHANMRDADLREADLRNANVYGADLSNADLRGADIRGVDFCESRIEGISLDGARVDDALCLPDL